MQKYSEKKEGWNSEKNYHNCYRRTEKVHLYENRGMYEEEEDGWVLCEGVI